MSEAPAPDIAVVYLLRKGNPASLLAAFLASLVRYPAGRPYQPVLLRKGYAPGDDVPDARAWVTREGTGPQIIDLSDEGFALTAFRAAARRITARRVLFLTSYSQMLAPDWLAKLDAGLDQLGSNAAVSASGSWEALDARTPFPNICLRTTGFLIERERFLAFPHRLETRQDGNDFEAGPANMTRSLLDSGGAVAVVDRDGRVIAPQHWPESLTFRSGNQERLLIADNRTLDYQTAGLGRRQRRAQRAFGERAQVGRQSLLQRWRIARAWRRGILLPAPAGQK